MKTKKLKSKKLKQKVPRKGVIEFDLTDVFEQESMLNALNADTMKSKIDTVYCEIFRPHLKHDSPIIEGSEELIGPERSVIEAIWNKVHNHFFGE